MKKIPAAAGAVLAVVLAAGCATTHGADGDPGRVVGRDEDHWTTRVNKTTTYHADYDLTVRRADGTEYDIDVSEDVFDHCYRGSRYPGCVEK